MVSPLAQPDLFDEALARQAHRLRGIRIRSGVTMRPRAVLEVDLSRCERARPSSTVASTTSAIGGAAPGSMTAKVLAPRFHEPPTSILVSGAIQGLSPDVLNIGRNRELPGHKTQMPLSAKRASFPSIMVSG
jgi:hypothetical protein